MAATRQQWTEQRRRDVKKVLYRFMGDLHATRAALYVEREDTSWSLVSQYGFGRAEPVARELAADHPMVRMVRAFDRAPRYYNGAADLGELTGYLSSAGNQRLLLVPLVDASGLVGFVDVRDKGGQRPFTDADVTLADAIGRDIVDIISNDGEAPPDDGAPTHAPGRRPTGVVADRGDGAEALLDELGLDDANAAADDLVADPRIVAVALSLTDHHAGGTVIHLQRGSAAIEIEPLINHQVDAMNRAQVPAPLRAAWKTEIRRTGAGCAPAVGRTVIATAVVMVDRGCALTASVVTDATPELARDSLHRLAGRLTSARDAFHLRVVRRGLARRLLQPGDRRYPELVAHSLGVSRLCWSIAKVLELDDGRAESAALAGLLHDVGMRELDYDRLYLHPTPGPEDRRTYRMHVEVGDRIVRVEGFNDIADAVRHHHERWDGNGYPDRLHGDDIPLLARIVHVAEVFDLFTAANSYRPAVSRERALAILERAAGHQFDPAVVEAIAKVVA
ncbi:MAG: HD domain-containing phosphohydrolase [Holophagae bacterium]